MANSLEYITTAIEIFSAEFLMRLDSMLGFVQHFPRNTNVGEYASHGQQLNIPFVNISGGLTERAVGGAVTASDISDGTIPVTMTHRYKAIKVDNLVNTVTNVQLMTRMASDLASVAAEGIDSVLYALWKKIPYQVGEVDGTAAFNSTDGLGVLADARLSATQNKWGTGPRYAVLTPLEANAFLKLENLHKVNEAGSSATLREGSLGRVFGFDVSESNTTDTTATLTTAAKWGTPLCVGAQAIGAASISVDGLGTGVVAAGSIFKLGAYYYTVAEDATITANAATLVLNEKLKEAAADNAPLTPTSHSAASGISLAFTPSAFVLVDRPMAPFMPGTGVLEKRITHPASGLNMRLLFESQGQGGAGDAMSQKITLDLMLGAAVIENRKAVRISGK